MSITIASLEVENVKAIRALYIQPSERGLTIIGGRNGQGKTSVLDAIAWALGGSRRQPSKAKREGAAGDPRISLTLSNGLKVERKGKNSALVVSDPSGARAGQALLDSFVAELALDLPKFLAASPKEKAETLLQVIGVGAELAELEREEAAAYNARHAIGQIASSKERHAAELPSYQGAPDEPISATELIRQQQAILARNAENRRLRERIPFLEAERERFVAEIARLQARLNNIDNELADARLAALDLQDDDTADLQRQLEQVEATNAKVAANKAKAAALEEAARYRAQYEAKSAELERIRARRAALLEGAKLPLPGLAVENGVLLFNGKPWDCLSGSEQLRVAVAIVRAIKPSCGFVLVDKLEQMDLQTLRDFAAWVEAEGLQCIATRVSTGSECTLIIEDGLPAGQTYADAIAAPPQAPPSTTDPAEEYGEF
jgi:energy-coupling factor transporter ATP-binding protein EcfA2